MRLCFIIGLFGLALISVAQANDQQTQQACMNVATCLLAVRSGASVRRSGFHPPSTLPCCLAAISTAC
jgi:hypothetical protein